MNNNREYIVNSAAWLMGEIPEAKIRNKKGALKKLRKTLSRKQRRSYNNNQMLLDELI